MVDGDPKSPICLVGMAPGREDLEQDRPFVGGTGAFLWAILGQVGITRADCYMVNIIGEWPAKKSGTPTAAQLAQWRPHFEEYINRFSGRILVPLGGEALRAITGLEDGIDAWRGYLVKPEECKTQLVSTIRMGVYTRGGKNKNGPYKAGDPRVIKERVLKQAAVPPSVVWVMPCLHPGSVLKSGKRTLPAFAADFKRVKRALKGNLRPPMEFVEAYEHTIDTGTGPFLIDVETTPYLRVGLAGRRGDGRPCVWTAPLSSAVRDAVQQRYVAGDGPFIAHNAQFDLAHMAKNGMAWDGAVYDTMVAAAMLQPDLYKGLNEVSSLYFDISRWKHKNMGYNAEYNLTDVKREYELYEVTKELLEEEGMMPLFQDRVMPGLRALTKMTARGIPVHTARRVKWLGELTEKNDTLLERWQGYVGNINPSSSPQVRKVLYQRYRLPIKYNKGGSESAERVAIMEHLMSLSDGDERKPVLQTLLDYKTNDKLLKNFARRPADDDGCIHPYYLPVTKDSDSDATGRGIAGTGRIQARDPNVQQIPGIARRIIVPRRADLCIVSCDFKQLELRIAGGLSGDRVLLDMLEAEDPFAQMMVEFGCDRTRAKNLAYGIIYGGSPNALVKALKRYGNKITFKEAKDLQARFSGRFKQLWKWIEARKGEALSQYALRTPFGRVRYFYGGRSDSPAAVNFMCQGTAADIMWSVLSPVEEATQRLGGSLLATIHDELLMEAPRDRLPEFIDTVKGIMGQTWDIIAPGFRVPAEAKVGDDWGSVQKWTGQLAKAA